MKRITILFLLFGLVIVGALIFTFYFLPKLDASNNHLQLKMSLPVERLDMRFVERGITPFCKDRGHGIGIETKQGAQVMAPLDGSIDRIEGNTVFLKDKYNVLLYFTPLSNINVLEGDYIISGQILGYVDGNNLEFGVDNFLDKRYECPYLFLDDRGKEIISNGLKESSVENSRICECSFISY